MSFRAERRGMPVVEATYRRTVPGDPAKRTHHPASRSGETPHHCELRSGLSEQRRYVEIANIRATRQGRDPEARRTHRVLATGRTLSVDHHDMVPRHTSPECQRRLTQPHFLTETAKRRARPLRRLRVPRHRLVVSIRPCTLHPMYQNCYSSPCKYCQKLKQGSPHPFAVRSTEPKENRPLLPPEQRGGAWKCLTGCGVVGVMLLAIARRDFGQLPHQHRKSNET